MKFSKTLFYQNLPEKSFNLVVDQHVWKNFNVFL